VRFCGGRPGEVGRMPQDRFTGRRSKVRLS
jgi:hypothetical protein